jgi:branched-chain amino acid transport system substrate-binding protein
MKAGIFMALFFLAACTFADNAPVRIGVIESLTGLAAEDGQNVVHAIQLAADDLRAAGNKIEVLVEDDKSTPKETVSAYFRLKQAGVQAIIAGPYSYTTEAIIPIAGREGMPVLNTSGLLESFNSTGSNGYFFCNAITMAADTKPFLRFLETHSPKTAVVIHVPSTWGKAQQKAYNLILKSKGIEILETIETLAQDNNEWPALVTKLVALRPELILLMLNKNDIDLILRKAVDQNFRPQFFGSKNTYDAWRLTRTPAGYENLCFTYPYAQLHKAAEFVRKFKAKYGEEPRIFADVSYDGLGILRSAILEARASTRPVKDVLQSKEFQGMVGTYRFSPDSSFAISQSSLLCVHNQELQVNSSAPF